MATLEIGRRRDRRRPALTTPTRSVWDRAASLAAMTRNMPHRSDYKLWNQSRAMTVWDAASFRPPHEFLIQFSNSKNFQTAKMFKSKTALRTPNLQTRVRASRRDAPESLKEDLTPREGLVRPRGRAGCRVPDAPAALCAKRVARPRTSLHSGGTGKPGNPARNGVTLYAVLSSGRCSIAPVLPRKMVCHTRLGGRASARITPASGAGPHGLPVRFSIVRPAPFFVSSQAQLNGRLPCQLRSRPIPPRPSHLIPRL